MFILNSKLILFTFENIMNLLFYTTHLYNTYSFKYTLLTFYSVHKDIKIDLIFLAHSYIQYLLILSFFMEYIK